MKGKRYSTEQKIRILRQADQAGVHIVDVCREHGISEQSFHRWKREFGLMDLDQAKQLKDLQKENARLKRMPSLRRSIDFLYNKKHTIYAKRLTKALAQFA